MGGRIIPKKFVRPNRLIFAVEGCFGVGKRIMMVFWGINLCYILQKSNDTGKFFRPKSAEFCCRGVLRGVKHDLRAFLGYSSPILKYTSA